MTRSDLLNQAKEMVANQTGLQIEDRDDCLLLCGKYILDGHVKEIPFYEDFKLRIRIPWTFPHAFPTVKETEGRIKVVEGFDHLMTDDGSLCLGAPCELADRLETNPTIQQYIDPLLQSYLYAFSYFEEYGVMPSYGGWSIGVYGLIESFKERYCSQDDETLFRLLPYLLKFKPYRGHMPCPCQSGKKFRDCHGGMILKDLSSKYQPILAEHATRVLKHYLDERKTEHGTKR